MICRIRIAIVSHNSLLDRSQDVFTKNEGKSECFAHFMKNLLQPFRHKKILLLPCYCFTWMQYASNLSMKGRSGKDEEKTGDYCCTACSCAVAGLMCRQEQRGKETDDRRHRRNMDCVWCVRPLERTPLIRRNDTETGYQRCLDFKRR